MPIITEHLLKPETQNDALAGVRAVARAGYESIGFPSTKDEDWKYTDLRALALKEYQFSDAGFDYSQQLPKPISTIQLIFVNGVLNAGLSNLGWLPDGCHLMSMREALSQNTDDVVSQVASAMPVTPNSLAQLNTGFFRDGAYLSVAEGTSIETVIELVFVSEGETTLSLPRNLIVLEKDAKATVVERHVSGDTCTALSNTATEIVLAEDATLDYYLVQTQGKKTSHIGATWVEQAQSSTFNARTITLGGQLVRNELKTSLKGEHAHTECIGLFVGSGRQHIDNHTTIRHAAPSCTSKELYKGILDDRARGVFHGRIVVEQDAQLTASEQENQNLLLSRNAEIDTKPQLEIYADDVKCSHGATVGQLDKKQVFYLQSRGIDKAAAEQLLTYAFAAEVLKTINIPALKTEIEHALAQTLISNDFADELIAGERPA